MTNLASIKAPVFCCPRTNSLTLNVSSIPVLRDALGPGIHFQPLLADPEIAGVPGGDRDLFAWAW
ncbi:hypothetical protein ACRAWD_27685 [Caulobacter segnis]